MNIIFAYSMLFKFDLKIVSLSYLNAYYVNLLDLDIVRLIMLKQGA